MSTVESTNNTVVALPKLDVPVNSVESSPMEPSTPVMSAVKRTRSKSPSRSPRSTKSPRKARPHPPNLDSVLTFKDSKLARKQIQVGNAQFEYGHNIGEMVDSTQLYRSGDREGLRQRLNSDGYIFLRGAINYNTAKRGREYMLNVLQGKGAFIPDTPMEEARIRDVKDPGWTIDAETGGFVSDREPDSAIEGWKAVGWSDEMRSVYAGPDLQAVYKFLWGQERTEYEDGYNMLSEVTWLRAKGKGEVTAEHADYYYFKQNTDIFQTNKHPQISRDASVFNEENPVDFPVNDRITCDLCEKIFQKSVQVPSLKRFNKRDHGEWHCTDCARQDFPIYTCWMSLGEYNSTNSSLCVMPKSHCLTEFQNPLKGDLLPQDYNNLLKSKWGWQRGEIGLGDIIIFNVKTVHGASKNLSNSYRLSIDTRVSAHWFRPRSLYGPDYKVEYHSNGTKTEPLAAQPDVRAGVERCGDDDKYKAVMLRVDAESRDHVYKMNMDCPRELLVSEVAYQSPDNSTRTTGAQAVSQKESPVCPNERAPAKLNAATVAYLEKMKASKKPRKERVLNGKMGMTMGMGMKSSEGGNVGLGCEDVCESSDEEADVSAVKKRRFMM